LSHQQQIERDPNDKEEAPMDVILFSGLEDIQLAQTPLNKANPTPYRGAPLSILDHHTPLLYHNQ